MKKIIFFTLMTFTFFFANAQFAPIMVCNPAGTSCTPYQHLDDAYEAANSGDYIYLPGGTFNLTKQVSKKIHIKGAGFEANGTPVTGITMLSDDIYLDSGANGSSFEGFYMPKGFRIRGTNSTLSGLTLAFINFDYIGFEGDESFGGSYNDMVIRNCVVRGHLDFAYDNGWGDVYGKYNLISNSFFTYWSTNIASLQFSYVKNVISSIYNHHFLYLSKDTSIENSIIGLNNLYQCENIIIENSIMNGNNYNPSEIFVNSDTFAFDPNKDFHIKPGFSPSNIGVYEGDFPWKDGSIPSNPHIYYKNIANSTDENGNLPVQIKVSAQ